ncbi:MAG: tetratricopeptide repeat protein [Tepidisphaeraceae bacterium]
MPPPVQSLDQRINQAVALGQQGHFEEAEALLRAIVADDPTSARAHHNLGVALDGLDKLEPALETLRRAAELRPDDAMTQQTLAKVLAKLGRLDESIEACQRAVQLNPNHAESHGSLARLLLMRGDFKRGWAEYEWRWKCTSFPVPRPKFEQPRWNGAKAPGKTILLYSEQGFGDVIQFVRFASIVARRCASVIVQSPRETLDLIRRMPDVTSAFGDGEPMPAFDLHAGLMSLPLLLSLTPSTIPSDVPYLSPSPKLVESWRERTRGEGARLRVGLAWAGRATHKEDKRRSIRLADFAPLAEAEGVVFYSLQKWDADQQASRPPADMRLIDTGPKLADFSDAAALMVNLDLIISVDTAVAHLAGALARPVWTLLPFAPDFRWMIDRSDTPWYPTMRLLRQTTRGDWTGPIRDATERLRAMATSGNAP